MGAPVRLHQIDSKSLKQLGNLKEFVANKRQVQRSRQQAAKDMKQMKEMLREKSSVIFRDGFRDGGSKMQFRLIGDRT
jgi:hypothetical protein